MTNTNDQMTDSMTDTGQQETEAVGRYKDALAAGLSDYEAREEGWPTPGHTPDRGSDPR